VNGGVSEDGRYLFVFMSKGSDNNNRLYYADLGDPKAPDVGATIKALVETDDAEYGAFGNMGTLVYLRSDKDAPNRKVIAIDLTRPDPASWKTIVPVAKQSIENVALIGGRLAVVYLVDVQSHVSLFALDGTKQGEIALPGAGSLAGLSGRADSPEIFYGFTSPLYPTTVFSYDAKTKTSTPFEAARPPIDVNRYETKQLFAPSKDGTRVPFFLTAKKNRRATAGTRRCSTAMADSRSAPPLATVPTCRDGSNWAASG
jgi:prolyl oligopeptidase